MLYKVNNGVSRGSGTIGGKTSKLLTLKEKCKQEKICVEKNMAASIIPIV